MLASDARKLSVAAIVGVALGGGLEAAMVLPLLREKHDEFMLRELVKRWSNHKIMDALGTSLEVICKVELEDDVLPSEAEQRYQEYKSEYISTQKRAYFDAHKGEDWLKDKYHPTNLLVVIERCVFLHYVSRLLFLVIARKILIIW
ncbi:hypothetical protein Hdeb2414_s0002g00067421 [Helianthus debilis subsp. tardiflorus]